MAYCIRITCIPLKLFSLLLSFYLSHLHSRNLHTHTSTNETFPSLLTLLPLHLSSPSVPAHFKSKFRAETVRKGQEAVIRCEAEGDRPLTISWTKDKNPLRTKDDLRYESTETPTKEGVISEIVIKNADRRDSALFTCIAANPYGEDETNIQMIMQGKDGCCAF